MKVAIFGLGYVGAVSGACFSELGHEVVGVDVSDAKVAMINRGEAPIVEALRDPEVEVAGIGDGLALYLHGRQADTPGIAIDAVDLAGDVLEAVLARMRQELHLLLVDVPGAGREGMQHRLPYVGRAAIDQSDAC